MSEQPDVNASVEVHLEKSKLKKKKQETQSKNTFPAANDKANKDKN